jgi:hypothetical protein
MDRPTGTGKTQISAVFASRDDEWSDGPCRYRRPLGMVCPAGVDVTKGHVRRKPSIRLKPNDEPPRRSGERESHVFVGKIAGTLASVVVALAGLTSVAAADVAAAPNCQHYGGFYTERSSAPVTGSAGGVGTIELCRDSDSNYWGFLILNHTPTTSTYGQVFLYRFHDGVPSPATPFTCDSAPQGAPVGGNGKILVGQTRCWTPRIEGSAGAWTFEANGTLWSSHTGELLASGWTARTR